MERPRQLSPAAQEVMFEIAQLWAALPFVARDEQVRVVLVDTICCRMVDLLEVYVRRVVELIIRADPDAWAKASKMQVSIQDALTLNRESLIQNMLREEAPRVASDFGASRKLLARFLKTEPFTPAQVKEIQDMKEIRNIIVHNNGIVDHPLAAQPTLKLGEKIHFDLASAFVALAFFDAVRHIDGALLQQYPSLGAEADHDELQGLLVSLNTALMALNVSEEEVQAMQAIAAQLLDLDYPFDTSLFSASLLSAGQGSFWTFGEDAMGYCAFATDDRVVGPFLTLEAARAWVNGPEQDWSGATQDTTPERWDLWKAADGLTLRCPKSQAE